MTFIKMSPCLSFTLGKQELTKQSDVIQLCDIIAW